MTDGGERRRVVPCDYDTDPGRFAANQAFRPAGADLSFGAVARRILAGPAAAAGPVLELGGGTGPLARELAGHGVHVVVADLAAMLSQAPRPAVRTDARAAGFRAASFGTVAALWMPARRLSHLGNTRHRPRVWLSWPRYDPVHRGRLRWRKHLRHNDVVKSVDQRANSMGTARGAAADAAQAQAQVPAQAGSEPGTRARIARLILENGPITAAGLSTRLNLTPAAVRRHLDNLLADGMIETRTARRPTSRGRGRPAKLFAITDGGRSAFEHAYDDLASGALRFLAEVAGPGAVAEFARKQLADLEDRYRGVLADAAPAERVQILAEALSADGYAASATGSPVETAGHGQQLCQHHCPVAHVAAEFPQLCEAETEAFARLLGTPVQRLATIAHGDGICTTHVTPPALLGARTNNTDNATGGISV